jgi:TolA-binding protein
MNMLSRKTVLAVASLAVLGMMGLQSCSSKATEEQMKTLSDLDRQRDALKSDLGSAQDKLRDLQGKIAQQDRDLSDCNMDTQVAKDGLTRWPNIWADSADWRMPAPMGTTTSAQ